MGQERQYCVVERMPCRVSSGGTWSVVSLGDDGDDKGCALLEGPSRVSLSVVTDVVNIYT
jgi:hypothetical protein